MKFALCVFIAALACATAAEANDKLCILGALNLLDERSGGWPIQSISISAPPTEYQTTPPVVSRWIVITFEGPGIFRWYYICKTEPGRQPVVKYLYTGSID
jgi:hypothetical protein